MLNSIWRSAAALIFLLAAAPLFATTYYVATNGSNSSSGTSVNQPWRTLQYAADRVYAGDTILVRGGSYVGAQFSHSGTSSQPIVLKAYPGETPRITADSPESPDGINLEGASWMVVDGFTINNRSRAGIRAVLCEHVTIRNNVLDHNQEWGILTGFCDDVLIENNIATNSVEQHGIYVSNSADRPIIRNNIVANNHGNGIHMNGDISSGGYWWDGNVDGVISGAVVEGNILYGNGQGGGSAINMDGVQDSVIRNNLIYDTHASGISVYRIDGGGPSTGNRIVNNTVIVASDGRWALNIQDGSTGTVVRNNILYNLGSYHGSIDISASSLPGLSSDNNVIMGRFTTDGGDSILGLAAWRALTGGDDHSLVATPSQLFVNAGSADYRLSAGSPALDAGQSLADVSADILGMARPQGGSYDIGAYERGAGGSGDVIFKADFD